MKQTTVIPVIFIVLIMTILIAGCTNSQAAPVPATEENLIEGKPTLLADGSCVIKEDDVVQECTAMQKVTARHTCTGKCSQ
jgi:hypothetical protein